MYQYLIFFFRLKLINLNFLLNSQNKKLEISGIFNNKLNNQTELFVFILKNFLHKIYKK